MLEMEACRYVFQNQKSGMWWIVKRGDVSLRARRSVRSPLSNPAEDGKAQPRQ